MRPRIPYFCIASPSTATATASIAAAAVALFATLFLGACARPAFTDALRRRYALSAADLRRVQFYTSDEIVLRREASDQQKENATGGLSIRDDLRVEDVVIPKGTPGVAVRVEGDYLLVSFSRARPDAALWFGLRRNDQGVLEGDGRYQLVQLENPLVERGPFHPTYSKTFVLGYAGARYHLADARMWNVYLLCELDEDFVRSKVREEPPGWRVSEGAAASTPKDGGE